MLTISLPISNWVEMVVRDCNDSSQCENSGSLGSSHRGSAPWPRSDSRLLRQQYSRHCLGNNISNYHVWIYCRWQDESKWMQVWLWAGQDAHLVTSRWSSGRGEMLQCLCWLHLWSHGHNNITIPTINYPNTLFNGHQLLEKTFATPPSDNSKVMW